MAKDKTVSGAIESDEDDAGRVVQCFATLVSAIGRVWVIAYLDWTNEW